MRPSDVLRSSEVPWSRMKRCVWDIEGAQLTELLLLVLGEVRNRAIEVLILVVRPVLFCGVLT